MSSVFNSSPTQDKISSWKIDVALAVIVGLLFSTLFYNTPLRVGDGSEYYGLFLAIKNHNVPWMTAGAYDDYGLLYASNQIKGLVSSDILRNTFPALNLGETADFNHFWFYSLPPAFLAKLVESAGIEISVQSAFLAWHAFLFFIPMRLAYRARGALGAGVVLALTICSPMVWFADKVHTEFFTYSLALSTFILVSQKRYVAAAGCMAVAATQNPSFAILSILLLLIRFLLPRTCKPEGREFIGAVGVGLLIIVHPLYYFTRFGVPTPQLLAGGAKIGGNFFTSYVWLFDPDLGLFPNWPLGLLIVFAMLFFVSGIKRDKLASPQILFIVAYLSINLFAQSSTTTLNSGATPGLARYALWYIPVFYPFAIFLGNRLLTQAKIYLTTSVLAALAIYFGINSYIYDPRQPESYVTPSPLSSFLQTYAPSLYDPPTEVFAKRFSDSGDSVATQSLSAIVGPSCDKALVFPNRDAGRISLPAHCVFTKDIILKEIAEARRRSSEIRYIRIVGTGAPQMLAETRSYFFREGDFSLGLLGSGWHRAESWGIWSKAPAQLSAPCKLGDTNSFKVDVTIRPFTAPGNPPTMLRIANGRDILFEGVLGGAVQVIPILVSKNSCDSKNRVLITITADHFRSPKQLALSDDDRPLGVGLEKIRYPDH
ncbi:hypothetical protein H7F36_08390 [Variovorax sp. PAMC28562]|uniref:hypothetical protein n=1 Tax=Variovorax sp. PAMC28562 TaxID=2762323 RepID=UPI00164CF2B9|nr:hypothetical protein [Variovorax sp. PAMC28562]QNK75203.1 hypothetical protein H7F36_08390 [Variovorax sp. PAMC28562]